jgi:hypothetical protein
MYKRREHLYCKCVYVMNILFVNIIYNNHIVTRPNTGFRTQCNLFAEMDYTINEEHVHYRRFIMQQSKPGN